MKPRALSSAAAFLFPIVVTLLTLNASTAHALVPAHLWSQRFGDGPESDEGTSVAVDASGNVFVTGYFQGTVNLGGGDLVSAGAPDVFLAKYDANGAHVWSRRFGGTEEDRGLSIALDASGNVLLTGYFRGTVNFGGGDLVSAGGPDIFLAKYDANGVHQWSRSFGNAGIEYAFSLDTDASGSVVVTGIFGNTVNFGGGALVSAGYDDVFLAKYDTNGVHQWSQRFGGWAYEAGNAVAIDGSGNILLTGMFFFTANFGGSDLSSAGDTDVFVAKYNSNGTHLWSRSFGGTNTDFGYSLATDASGSVFVTGYFKGTCNLGGANLVSAGNEDVFLARYDASGTHQWSRRFGGAASEMCYSVAVDPPGNAVITGLFQATANFGGGNLVGSGVADMFLASYDADGLHLWSRSFGGNIAVAGQAVAVDGSGNFALTGNFAGGVDFGGGYLLGSGYGDDDIFLARFTSLAEDPLITSITDIGNDQGRKVKIRFDRSGHDQAASGTPVMRYEAYRRDDAPPQAAASLHALDGRSDRELLADGWTQVGSVDAHQEASYGIDVPTLGDSTISLGQYFSVFYVRAATAAPGIFFDSTPDSGYSIDNLAPGVPGGLLYNSGILSWNESPAEDFDYFTVYGANVDAFGSSTIVDYSVAPTMDVTAAGYAYYFVTATDFSGNEGKAARINTLSGVGGTPESYVLSVSNFPNPFNPRTTVSYTVPSRGNVTVVIYDARGARVATLVDGQERDAGAYRLEWAGQDDNGLAVPSGIYFARIVQGDAVRSRKMVLLK